MSGKKIPVIAVKALIIIALGLLAAPQLWYPFGFDQGVYAACGDVIRRGGIPIQDCFETKQPGVMVMYSIPMLFSLAPMAVHAFTLLWTALTAIVIGQAAKRLFHPRAAWPAAILYWLAYAGINYWSMDQAETYANLFIVLALFATWKVGEAAAEALPGQRIRWLSNPLWLVIGGACIGISFWFKYVFALIGIALAVCLLIHVWSRSRSLATALLNSFAFGVVALAVAGLGVLYYALNNALPALVSQFQFLLAAFPLGPPRTIVEIGAQLLRFFDNGADITADFKATVPQWNLLGAGFPLMLVLAVVGAWQRRRQSPIPYLYLVAHFVAAAAVVVWQANYIQYHYTIMLPAFVIAASAADLRIQIRTPRDKPVTVFIAAGLVAATVALLALRMLPWVIDMVQNVVVLGKSPTAIYQESRAAPNVSMAQYISEHSGPSDAIAIFGDAPWVYTLSNRHNATRFSFINLWMRKREAATYPLFTSQYLDGLQRNQPLYFLLTKADFPWQGVDYIPDYKASGAIYEYVEGRYAYEGENGPFLIFHRK